MTDDDYIFQFAPLGSDNWMDNPHSDYLKSTWLRDIPVGQIQTSYAAQHRRVPKDPMIRAIVLAQMGKA